MSAHSASTTNTPNETAPGNKHPVLIATEMLAKLPTSGTKLPVAVRNALFELIFDTVDEFNFPVQNMGVHPTAVEAGDVCGFVEKKVVILLRALNAATPAVTGGVADVKIQSTVAALEAIDGTDPEKAHGEADELLLTHVPGEVADAYNRVVARSRWWNC